MSKHCFHYRSLATTPYCRKKEFVAHPFVQSLLKEQNFGKFMNKSVWDRFLLLLYWLASTMIFPYYGIQYLLKDPRQRKLRYSDLGEYIDFMATPVLCLIADTISFILCFAFLIKICLQDELPSRPLEFSMGYEYILWACVVGQIYTETIQLRKLGWKKYVTHFWNCIDILIIVTLVVAAGVRIYTLQFTVIRPLLTSATWILYGLLGFLQTIKFISLTDSSNVLGPLQLAMKSMIADLFQIMVLLGAMLFGFSLCIFVVMRQLPNIYQEADNGNPVSVPWRFSSLAQTVATLFWSLFGFIDFLDEMRETEESKAIEIYITFYLIFAG